MFVLYAICNIFIIIIATWMGKLYHKKNILYVMYGLNTRSIVIFFFFSFFHIYTIFFEDSDKQRKKKKCRGKIAQIFSRFFFHARSKIDDVFVLRLIWVQIYVYEKCFAHKRSSEWVRNTERVRESRKMKEKLGKKFMTLCSCDTRYLISSLSFRFSSACCFCHFVRLWNEHTKKNVKE